MLHSVKDIFGFAVVAADGEVGSVDDVYFDEREWTIRYLVVDTGGWLAGHQVLIAPRAIAAADWPEQSLRVGLSRKQVEDSPGIDAEKTVSRQRETEFHDYYGYPYYWTGPYLWGYAPLPAIPPQEAAENTMDPAAEERREMERARTDSHLRSVGEVTGYEIRAAGNDSVGYIKDFLFDDSDWSIRLIVVDTSHWWPGKEVLIPPSLIRQVNWDDKTVAVDVAREQIENSPEYDHLNPPHRDPLQVLYRHFIGPWRW